MPKKLVELEAVFLRERNRFPSGDAGIIEARLFAPYDNGIQLPKGCLIALRGAIDDGDPYKQNLSYRFWGKWETYRNQYNGKEVLQFAYNMSMPIKPHTKESVIAYLAACGKGHGISTMRAEMLWNVFGCDAMRVIRETPENSAASIKGWSIKGAEEMAQSLCKMEHVEHTTIDLIELLVGRGFPRATAKEALRIWGVLAPQFIRRNPYLLMSFRGCGFKRCDAMYLDLGLPAARVKRQTLSACYELAKDCNGHTWFPVDVAVRGILSNVSGISAEPLKALQLGKRAKVLSFQRTDAAGEFCSQDGNVWVAEHKKAEQENELAARINAKMREPNLWPDLSGVRGLSDHQAAKLASSLAAPLGIFRGGPGVGKTHSCGRLVEHLQRFFGPGQIGLCSPTNKAAHRLTQSMRDNQIGLSATSIHRMLGVESVGRGGWTFRHCETRPLPYKVLILDEASMPDTGLMLHVLRAIPRGCMVLLVGDTNQLPPIQHGAPMRDMLASGLIPSGELTEPQRNAGRIVQACDEIRRGERFEESLQIDPLATPPENFKILIASTPTAQIEKLLMVMELARSQGIDPVWEAQCMCAVNDKSPVSRKALNELLQRELNPGGEKVTGNSFRIGDKVICKQNGTYPDVEYVYDGGPKSEDAHFVANGEFGKVVGVAAKYTDVLVDFPDRYVRFPLGGKEKEEKEEGAENFLVEDESSSSALQLGYAATVHSFQGSETKISIPILDASGGGKMVGSREWFFTAISRGKFLTLPIGQRGTADLMCRKSTLAGRKTFLSERIREKAKEA